MFSIYASLTYQAQTFRQIRSIHNQATIDPYEHEPRHTHFIAFTLLDILLIGTTPERPLIL